MEGGYCGAGDVGMEVGGGGLETIGRGILMGYLNFTPLKTDKF